LPDLGQLLFVYSVKGVVEKVDNYPADFLGHYFDIRQGIVLTLMNGDVCSLGLGSHAMIGEVDKFIQ
jgi:hypothetical protein